MGHMSKPVAPLGQGDFWLELFLSVLLSHVLSCSPTFSPAQHSFMKIKHPARKTAAKDAKVSPPSQKHQKQADTAGTHFVRTLEKWSKVQSNQVNDESRMGNVTIVGQLCGVHTFLRPTPVSQGNLLPWLPKEQIISFAQIIVSVWSKLTGTMPLHARDFNR